MARGLLLGLLLASCGGRTEGGVGETGEPGAPDSEQGDLDQDRPTPPSKVDGDTPLGECVPGFPPHSPQGRSCPWLADRLCYETREMACNCVCPRDRDSQCTSGFERGPDSRVEVSCN